MCGYLAFLSLKRWFLYSVYSIFNWTPNWHVNLSCIFYAVQAHLLEKRPWHHGKISCDHSLMTCPTMKKTTLKVHNWKKKKKARTDYNKFPSGFHQERKESYSVFTHSQPVPEVLNKELLRLWFGRMCTWRCRGGPSWREGPFHWRREEGISWEETEEGILFLHLSVFIFTLVWPCLPLCSVCFKSDSEFMEPFRRMSHNLWFMTSCRNWMLVNNTLSVWNCISELWNITSADKSF